MTKTLMKCVTTLAVTLALAPQPADAQRIVPPAVPDAIQVPAGNKAFLVGHAVGTQNYICQESTTAPSGVAWALFGPQATLFNEDDGQIITHFLSPNPVEGDMPRATWQHSQGHEPRLGDGRHAAVRHSRRHSRGCFFRSSERRTGPPAANGSPRRPTSTG